MTELLTAIQCCDNFPDLEVFANSECWINYRRIFQAIVQKYFELLDNQPDYFHPFGNEQFSRALVGQLIVPNNSIPAHLPLPLVIQSGSGERRSTATEGLSANFYDLKLKRTERVKRFGTTGNTYSLSFKDLEAAPDLEATLIGIFNCALQVRCQFLKFT